MRFRICHLTRYGYPDPVSLCHSVAHLKPRDFAHQRCLSSQVRVDPWPAVSRDYLDFFGNRVTYFSIQQSHGALEVTAQSEVEVTPQSLPTAAATPAWEWVLERLRGGRGEAAEARIFTLASPMIPHNDQATDYARASFAPGRPVLEAVTDLMGRIFRDFEYDPHFSNVATPLSEVLEHRRGVCQDFAHLGLACLRGLGLAARYVSGYLETLPPPGQVKLQGSDASHAWFAVFIPDLGWVDFDPTNDQIPGQQHITTAIGRDYQDVTPLRGVFYGGGAHDLRIAVDVNRVEVVDALGVAGRVATAKTVLSAPDAGETARDGHTELARTNDGIGKGGVLTGQPPWLALSPTAPPVGAGWSPRSGTLRAPIAATPPAPPGRSS